MQIPFSGRGQPRMTQSSSALESQSSSPFAIRGAEQLLKQSDKSEASEDLAQHVISDRASVPDGKIIDLTKLADRPYVPSTASLFVVILSPVAEGSPAGSAGMIHILWSEQTSSIRQLMDLRLRLKVNGFGLSIVMNVQATPELIRLVNEGVMQSSGEAPEMIASEVEKYARDLIVRAEASGASDVHIHITPSEARIYFRIHGKFVPHGEITSKRGFAAGHFWYGWQSQDSSRNTQWTPTTICDTQFTMGVPSGVLTVRFHSSPMHPQGSCQIVMRLLRPASSSNGFRPLDRVGYEDGQLRQIEQQLSSSKGLILLGGPTNSGKSSSLQSFVAAVRVIRGEFLKIPTIENPVEYEMKGACQMASTDADFTEYLRATLRQDPDLVVVGEIRSPEAASIVREIVLAGFPTYSTLHMADCVAAFNRLIQLGLPREVLTDPGFISAIVFQRLVPQVCPHCSLTWDQAIEGGLIVDAFYNRVGRVFKPAEMSQLRFHNVDGCPHCKHTGLVGRIPCAEVLVPDDEFLLHIREGRTDLAAKYWREQLGKPIGKFGPTALSHGIDSALKGLVDPRDVEHAVGLLTDVLRKS